MKMLAEESKITPEELLAKIKQQKNTQVKGDEELNAMILNPMMKDKLSRFVRRDTDNSN